MEAEKRAQDALAKGDIERYVEYKKESRHLQALWYRKQGINVPESQIPLDLYVPPPNPIQEPPTIDIPVNLPMPSGPN